MYKGSTAPGEGPGLCVRSPLRTEQTGWFSWRGDGLGIYLFFLLEHQTVHPQFNYSCSWANKPSATSAMSFACFLPYQHEAEAAFPPHPAHGPSALSGCVTAVSVGLPQPLDTINCKVIQNRARCDQGSGLTSPKCRSLPAYPCPSKASSFLSTLSPREAEAKQLVQSQGARVAFFPRISFLTEMLAQSVGSAVCGRPVGSSSARKLGRS